MNTRQLLFCALISSLLISLCTSCTSQTFSEAGKSGALIGKALTLGSVSVQDELGVELASESGYTDNANLLQTLASASGCPLSVPVSQPEHTTRPAAQTTERPFVVSVELRSTLVVRNLERVHTVFAYIQVHSEDSQLPIWHASFVQEADTGIASWGLRRQVFAALLSRLSERCRGR